MIFQKRIQSGDTYERHPRVRWRTVEGKAVLVDSLENEIVHFNETGTHVWENLDGKTTVGGILDTLGGEEDVSPDLLKKDVMKFIRRLSEMELIRKKEMAS